MKTIASTERLARSKVRVRLRALVAFSPRLATSVSNQVVSSGANFAFGQYLIRTLSPFDFGLYGISISMCLLYAGLGNALFLTQMVVRLPDKSERARPAYKASVLAQLGVFGGLSLVIAAVSHLSFVAAGYRNHATTNLILATAVAAVANLAKSYFVTLAYSDLEEYKALCVNVSWAAALAIALVVSTKLGGISTAGSAMWLFAIANIIAVPIGLAANRLPLRGVSRAAMWEDFAEAFAGGRWAVGGVGVTWIQSQSYMYVCALSVGPTGVALANAARLIIAPFTFLMPALTQLVLPRLAQMRAAKKSVYRGGLVYSTLLVGMGAAYLAASGVGAKRLIPLLIGQNYSYDQVLPIAATWGVILLLQLSKEGASLAMQASKRFRGLALANAATAAISVVATAVLAVRYGVSGAVIGVGVGEALLTLLLWERIKYATAQPQN